MRNDTIFLTQPTFVELVDKLPMECAWSDPGVHEPNRVFYVYKGDGEYQRLILRMARAT